MSGLVQKLAIASGTGNPMQGRHLTSLSDISVEELRRVLDVAAKLKAQRVAGQAHPVLAGKTLAMVFQSPLTAHEFHSKPECFSLVDRP